MCPDDRVTDLPAQPHPVLIALPGQLPATLDEIPVWMLADAARERRDRNDGIRLLWRLLAGVPS